MTSFPKIVRDATKMFALWPSLDDGTLTRFVREVHKHELEPAEVLSLRETTGVDNSKFREIGRSVCEWVVLQHLGTVGYNGRTVEQLVASATEAVEQTVSGRVSPLLVAEWVQDLYEEMSVYSRQPMNYRLKAAEKAVELKGLLQCQSLPKISLRG